MSQSTNYEMTQCEDSKTPAEYTDLKVMFTMFEKIANNRVKP